MELSYCVVNTNGRELLLECLRVDPRDPSGGHRARNPGPRQRLGRRIGGGGEGTDFPRFASIRRERRAGLAENNSLIMGEARGDFCLLLNEDSELLDGAVRELLDALRGDRGAAVAGAQLVDPDGEPIPCAWRFPEPGDGACAGAPPPPAPRHPEPRRRRPAAGGGLDPVVHDAGPPRGRRQRRLSGHGLLRLLGGGGLPEAHARRRLANPPRAARPRDPPRAARHRPLRRAAAAGSCSFTAAATSTCRSTIRRPWCCLSRLLWSASYVPRALAAIFMRGQDPGTYWLHARQALRPAQRRGHARGGRRVQPPPTRRGGQVPERSSSRAAAS